MTQAYTQRFTEVHLLGDWTQPMTGVAGQTWQTDWESMAIHQRAVYMLFVGAMAAGATITYRVDQATDAAGANQKAIAGKAITQLTQAGGDATSAVIIEVRSEELDVDGGFTFVSGISLIGVNDVTFMQLPLFGASNYVPVPTAGWTEIVD